MSFLDYGFSFRLVQLIHYGYSCFGTPTPSPTSSIFLMNQFNSYILPGTGNLRRLSYRVTITSRFVKKRKRDHKSKVKVICLVTTFRARQNMIFSLVAQFHVKIVMLKGSAAAGAREALLFGAGGEHQLFASISKHQVGPYPD